MALSLKQIQNRMLLATITAVVVSYHHLWSVFLQVSYLVFHPHLALSNQSDPKWDKLNHGTPWLRTFQWLLISPEEKLIS